MQWTLRSRLEAAERDRRLAAGLSPEDPEANPASVSDTIDLTDTRQAALAQAVGARVPVARFTSPTSASAARSTVRDLEPATRALPVWQQGAAAAPARPTPSSQPSRTTLTSSLASSVAEQTGVDSRRERVVTTTQPTRDRCPQCQGTVRLLRFDLDRAVAEMHCLDCGLQYTAKSPKL